MMKRYSLSRDEAKRQPVENPSGADFDAGRGQNRAQFFASEKSEEAKSLKRFGEPGRTRTSNPLMEVKTINCFVFLRFSLLARGFIRLI
jgi:hypothetical protein